MFLSVCPLCDNPADDEAAVGCDPYTRYVPVCHECAARDDVIEELEGL